LVADKKEKSWNQELESVSPVKMDSQKINSDCCCQNNHHNCCENKTAKIIKERMVMFFFVISSKEGDVSLFS
jgi:hypothetical protein